MQHVLRCGRKTMFTGLCLLTFGCAGALTDVDIGMASLHLDFDVHGSNIEAMTVDVLGPGIPEALIFEIEVEDGRGEGTITVPVGSNRLLTVHAFDKNGIETHSGSAVTDVVQGTNPTIHITLLPLTGDVPIEVTIGGIVVKVDPRDVALDPGEEAQLTVSISDADGNPISGDVIWASTNPVIASVNDDGLVRARKAGTADIVANFGNARGVAHVSVSGEVIEVVIDGFSDPRTDGNWGITESFTSQMRDQLLDPANFSRDGVVKANIVIGTGVDLASLDNLKNVDVFFVGWVPTNSYTFAEKQALLDFVRNGGSIIATTDDTGHNMIDIFGATLANGAGGVATATITNPSHPIADGPFGAVTSFTQRGNIGHYTDLGPNAVEVGRNPNGIALAVIEAGALAPGSGRVVFISDVDVFTNGNQNTTFNLNVFAWAMGR